MHSFYFTVTKVKLEKNHTEMQEDTQQGNKWIMTKPRGFSPLNMDLTFYSVPYFLIRTDSSAAQTEPASQERVCIMPRPVGLQANIRSGMCDAQGSQHQLQWEGRGPEQE